MRANDCKRCGGPGVRIALTAMAMALVFAGCEPERVVIRTGPGGVAGRHVGIAWLGEAGGVAREEATAYVEAMIELDADATILDARLLYFERIDGYWTTRQSGNAYVAVDFTVTPTPATPGREYRPGNAMFTLYTANQMSLYAVAVSPDGVVAAAIVEPLTRYRFELKFPIGFDYDTRMDALTLDSGLVVPTTRASTGAWLNPAAWDELADRHLLAFHDYSHVLTDTGVFKGLDGASPVRALLEAMGVAFAEDRPVELAPRYGYFGLGGWGGNYTAIARYLTGRNAREQTALVDWSAQRYAGSIDAQRRFGVEVVTGATITAQNSLDGIAGATVRVSRESTAYQRALVQAGILTEDEVIIGRF